MQIILQLRLFQRLRKENNLKKGEREPIKGMKLSLIGVDS